MKLSDHAVTPHWSNDASKALYGIPGKGLWVFYASMPSEPAYCLSKDAIVTSGSFSPDGQRVAYSTASDIWISDIDGKESHRVARGIVASCLSWSSDGRFLAYCEPGLGAHSGKLGILRANGSDPKIVGESKALGLKWSPNDQWLLVFGAENYALEVATGTKIALPDGLMAEPHWVGAKKLSIATKAGVSTMRLGSGSKPELQVQFSTQDVDGMIAADVAPWLELTNDLIMKNPLDGLSKPRVGTLRVHGYVDSAQPLTGLYDIQVDSVRDSKGQERFFRRAVVQTVDVSAKSTIVGQANSRPFRSIDLRMDDEVSMVIQAEKLDPKNAVEVRELSIADFIWDRPTPKRAAPHLQNSATEYDGVSREKITVPIVFPVLGKVSWSDNFLASRDGGKRRHHGQDIMAPKMRQLVACFDGIVRLRVDRGKSGNVITIEGDNGWIANYYHVNNDTPGTDDGQGTELYAFAPGLRSGQHVYAGQFIGYVGDSGNAESTAPHLHFELWDATANAVVNATASLRAAGKLSEASARIQSPDIKLKPGEVRYDAILTSIDKEKGLVVAEALAKTEKGKTRSITRSTKLYAYMDTAELVLLENENMTLKVTDLRPGLYVALIGSPSPNGKAMHPRRAAFAAQ